MWLQINPKLNLNHTRVVKMEQNAIRDGWLEPACRDWSCAADMQGPGHTQVAERAMTWRAQSDLRERHRQFRDFSLCKAA